MIINTKRLPWILIIFLTLLNTNFYHEYHEKFPKPSSPHVSIFKLKEEHHIEPNHRPLVQRKRKKYNRPYF